MYHVKCIFKVQEIGFRCAGRLRGSGRGHYAPRVGDAGLSDWIFRGLFQLFPNMAGKVSAVPSFFSFGSVGDIQHIVIA
jgi:hypothetical protein